MLLFKLSYIHSPNIQTVKISQHACLMSTISKFKKKKRKCDVLRIRTAHRNRNMTSNLYHK